jgi:hypothetical protein
MTDDVHSGEKGWAKRVLEKWLDSRHQVSTQPLRENGWSALPVADVISAMEAEWLADAIQAQGTQTAVGLAFEYGGEPYLEDVPAARDAILSFNGRNSWRYALLTSFDESFLWYKDDANRFYLLCGNAPFKLRAYRCTWDTARITYFDEWVSLDHHSDDERRFMTEVWNKYAAFG